MTKPATTSKRPLWSFWNERAFGWSTKASTIAFPPDAGRLRKRCWTPSHGKIAFADSGSARIPPSRIALLSPRRKTPQRPAPVVPASYGCRHGHQLPMRASSNWCSHSAKPLPIALHRRRRAPKRRSRRRPMRRSSSPNRSAALLRKPPCRCSSIPIC